MEDWLKIGVFYFLLVTTVHDEDGLKLLAIGFLTVMGLYLLHSFREYLGGLKEEPAKPLRIVKE